MKLVSRYGFGARRVVFHRYFCIRVVQPPFRSKVYSFFSSSHPLQLKSHDILPNSFVKLAWSWLWKLFRHTKPQNELFSNAASRFVFDMKRLGQCLFKTLPSAVNTLCAKFQEQVHSVASRACQKIQEQLSTRKRQERYYEPNQSPNPNTQNNTSVYS
jgi:hypothetical protein